MVGSRGTRGRVACGALLLLTVALTGPGRADAQGDAPVDPSRVAPVSEAAAPNEPVAIVAEAAAPRVADRETRARLDDDPRFTPPPPSLDATTHDLLMLESGEWLQGDIRSIRDGHIDFDSVELEDLAIDLDDVREIHADRFHTYRFEGNRDILTGPVRMNAEIVLVGDQERPRDDLITQVAGKPIEWNFWNGDLSVGYSISSGNTNQSDLTIRAALNRETALTRFTNVYNAALSTADVDDGAGGTTQGMTANSHRLNSAFDYYVSSRFYLIVPAFQVYADEFQNIDLRLAPSAGVGVDWLEGKRYTWDLSASSGYIHTKRVSVPVGAEKTTNDAVLILGTAIETDPTDDIEWDTSYQVQLVPADMAQTNHHLESLLSIDLVLSLDLDITFIWDRIEDPEPIVTDPGPPEVTQAVQKNDYRLTFGIGWDF